VRRSAGTRSAATGVGGRPLLVVVVPAAAGALAWLLVAPDARDLAAHAYRAALFGREGFALWDGGWYAGHHLPGYSVLFPPLAWTLGLRPAGALAVIAAAAGFGALAARHLPPRPALVASAWFGIASLTLLLSGRLAFAAGLAAGFATLLTRRRFAPVLAVLTALLSPVAAIFLALAAAARRAPWVAVAALVPVAVLAVLFPEGGTEPFAFSAFWPCVAVAVGALVLLPHEARVLRTGVALYGVLCVVLFAVPTPVGGNAARLGALVAGPLAAAALLPGRARVLAAVALPLAAWPWLAAVRDVADASGDPSTERAYFAPLLMRIERAPGPPGRLEIPLTANHQEAARVAPRIPLARGWERQLDRKVNRLFYVGPLTPARYRRWLTRMGIEWVALSDVALDASARAEARLLRAGAVPGLREQPRAGHWRLWRAAPPDATVPGPARLLAGGADTLLLDVPRPKRPVLVRVRWTPYWRTREGCASRSRGGRLRVRATRAGHVRLVTSFSLRRVGARSERCG
jgi:hypothetical protein